MSRYEKMFTRLNEKNQGAFVPFVTVCDPNAEQSYKIMEHWLNLALMRLNLVFRSQTHWRTAQQFKVPTFER